jgi:hypothetical protein
MPAPISDCSCSALLPTATAASASAPICPDITVSANVMPA